MLLAKLGCVFLSFILNISGVDGRVRHICALKGSSVEITALAEHPTAHMKWYTVQKGDSMSEVATEDQLEVSHLSLKIKDLTESVANKYCFAKNGEYDNCLHHRIHLHVSDLDDPNCWSEKYEGKKVCALQGSTVNISKHVPPNKQTKSKLQYEIKSTGWEDAVELSEAANYNSMKNQHNYRNNILKENDPEEDQSHQTDTKGIVKVMFTGLRVVFSPSAVVTEGQRVTLTCSTSCPLTHYTNYIWYLNSRPLNHTENQDKELVLDPVSSQHAGNYSCAVQSPLNTSSQEKSLTVHTVSRAWIPAAGVGAVLLIVTPLIVFAGIRCRTSRQAPETEATDNTEQSNPVYANISTGPAEREELHYSRVYFSKNPKAPPPPPHSAVQPPDPKQQEPVVHYSAVNFRPKATAK